MSRQAGMTRRSPAPSLAVSFVFVLVFVLGAAAVLAAACSKPAGQGSAEQRAAEQPAAEQPAMPEDPAAAPPAATAMKGGRYTLDRDGTQVTLSVTWTRGEIAFELVTRPADPKCGLRLSGTAKEKGGDLEPREDEHGEMIAVAEYLSENEDCRVSISLEMGERSMAWVSTADCPSVPESCWLNMFGPLRKQ